MLEYKEIKHMTVYTRPSSNFRVYSNTFILVVGPVVQHMPYCDDIVESCYPGYPFASDEARLECLFKLYEKMTKGI